MRSRGFNAIRSGADLRRAKVLPRELRGSGKTPEGALLKQIKNVLDIFKAQGFLSYRRIHVMPIRVGRFQCRPNRDMVGMEDLQVYLMGGRVLFWELKFQGKQSAEQKKREDELLALGLEYKVIKSLEQAISELRAKGLSLWTY